MTDSGDGDPSSFDASVPQDEPRRADVPPLRLQPGGELGRGAMGVVRAAFDPVLERTVALKTPREAGPSAEARLLREAKLVARLDHPAIVGVLDVGVDASGRLTAVLPVRQGRSLGEAVASEDGAPSQTLLRALLVVAQAVGHAHGKGLVHRDLSPGNVRLGADGAVWVLDWGLAATLEEAARPGFTGGTHGFAAPEQLEGRPGGTAADVFSLGALLRLICTRSATVTERPPTCSPALWAIARKALEPEPARRYRDAQAFAADLTHWLDGLPVEAWPEGPFARLARRARRAPRVTATIVGAVLTLFAVVAVASVQIASAQQRARRATATLLIDSAERALHVDDIATARRLASEALTAVDSPRARGVLAAAARVADVEVVPLREDDCVEVDALDQRRICAQPGGVELRGAASTKPGPGEQGVFLNDGRSVIVSRAQNQVRVHRVDGAEQGVVTLGGGAPDLRVSRDRQRAVVSVAEHLVLISIELQWLAPCTPGQAIRFSVFSREGLDVFCADDEWVSLDARGQVARRTRILGLGTLLRGAVTGDRVDDDRIVIGSANGEVGLLSRSRSEVTRVASVGLGLIHTALTSNDGRTVLLVGERGVGQWRVEEGHLLPTSLTGLDGVRTDGAGFIGWKGTKRWRLSGREGLSVSTNLHGRAALAVHDGTRRVATGDALGNVELFSLDSGFLARIEGPPRVVKSLAFSASGRWLGLGAAGAEGVLVFDTSVTPPVRVAGPWEGRPELRGRHVLFVGDDLFLVFSWGPGPFAARYSKERNAFVEEPIAAVPPDIRGAATDGTQVRALDVTGGWHSLAPDATGHWVAREEKKWTPVPFTVAASPDLSTVVTAEGTRFTRDGVELVAAAPIEALALEGTGRLAVCRRDGVVEVRDANGTVQLEIPAHEGRCGRVSFCDAGRAVCSVGWDGRLRVSEL